ncbi:hypothetical protein [Sphingobacterium corticibacter]|uniref:Uncharacterized protein n=1 Tax=Sphingobacterium corticibacter TaxID=2171749 RepID=A0A2T8HLI1_9SPHI|nr:hypothetical protein [Sphingobacterium corticibacter]PVH26263.1 hypothetical protein DC487_01160 [Sphingobacterium corticibacter]
MIRDAVPKPKARQPLTDERKYALLCDVQFMGIVIQMIENRWRNNLFDVNLGNQTLKNFSSQVYRGIQGMKREMTAKFNLKHPDELEYEMSAAMDRAVSFLSLLPAELVDKIVDGLEQGQNEMIKQQIAELQEQK